MRISSSQMDALAQADLEKFENRLADFLYQEFPDAKDIPREQLLSEIHKQVEKARSYGLETEQQAATYITTAWLLGTDFDTEFPAAQEVLPSDDYTADEKAEWLGEWTTAMFKALDGEEAQ